MDRKKLMCKKAMAEDCFFRMMSMTVSKGGGVYAIATIDSTIPATRQRSTATSSKKIVPPSPVKGRTIPGGSVVRRTRKPTHKPSADKWL